MLAGTMPGAKVGHERRPVVGGRARGGPRGAGREPVEASRGREDPVERWEIPRVEGADIALDDPLRLPGRAVLDVRRKLTAERGRRRGERERKSEQQNDSHEQEA